MTSGYPKYHQRFWIYVLGPNQDSRLSSVAANARIDRIRLPIDPDSPFLLRGLSYRVRYDTTVAVQRQAGLPQVQARFTGPDQNYFQQVQIPLGVMMAFGGQLGSPKPIYPQVVYPPQSVLYVDLINNGSATLTNLTFYFFGVKVFPWGLHRAPTYPLQMATVPFAYDGTVTAVPVTTATQGLRNVFVVNNDTDFVLRAISSGQTISKLTWEIFFRLYDSDLYPYMSDFVHFDVIAGNAQGGVQYPVGPTPTFVTTVGVEGSSPGLVVPEIYIPFKNYLYYDVLRTDAAFVGQGAVTQDYPIVWQGAKVFPK